MLIPTLSPIPSPVSLNERIMSIHERTWRGEEVSSDDLIYLSECELEDE